MIIDFSNENFKMIFEIIQNGMLCLTHFSGSDTQDFIKEEDKIHYPAVEIQVAGGNPNTHHGTKNIDLSETQSLKYINHEITENKLFKLLKFHLENDRLAVDLYYQYYKNCSSIRSWSEVKNISSSDVGIEYISSFSFTGIDTGNENADEKMSIYIPSNSWTRELNWNKHSLSSLGLIKNSAFSTSKINFSSTGTWPANTFAPMLAVSNSETSDFYFCQIECNGSWQWEISDIADRIYLKLSGPTDRENSWYKCLKPNQSFTTVKTAVSIGNSFNDALAKITEYRRKIVRKNITDEKIPIIFNDYMNCLDGDPTEEKTLPLVDRAAEMGAEYYCVDAGWYADGPWWDTVGEWLPCKWRFPHGIKYIFDYIRSKGMIPGIWLEIEVMGIECPILNQFSNDCFFMRHGKKVIDHGRYQLDFRNPRVISYATETVRRVIEDYGAGYIKIDYNIEAGTGTEVSSDSTGDGLLEHNRAYLKWLKDIMDKYPEVVFENCSSGGMRMDYALLSLHPIQSVTDRTDYQTMGIISACAPTGVLPEQAAIWTYPQESDNADAVVFNMVNTMPLRMHLSGNIQKMSKEMLAYVKEGIDAYNSFKHKIPEMIPFYPVGIPSYCDKWICSAFSYKNEVYLNIKRLETEQNFFDIPFGNNIKSCEVIYPHDTGFVYTLKDNILTLKSNRNNCAVLLKLKF